MRPARLALALAVAVALTACGSTRPPAAPAPPATTQPPRPPAPPPSITWRRVEAPADVPAAPPAPGTWRVHLIDVGTGLAVLVQGADFALLFDAGTSDPGEQPLRVVAHLAAALGRSGGAACSEDGGAAGGERALDHVVLSHAHQDHVSALDLVLACFAVRHVWEPGVARDTIVYRDFVAAVAAEPGVTYHTVAEPPATRTVVVKGAAVTVPPAVRWRGFGEGQRVRLGRRAGFEVLHAEGKRHADPNQESLVIAVQLGRARLLLTGDAESGPRAPPSAPAGDVEAYLLEHARRQLDADILQVGHHGSLTSSRASFVAAVSPSLALVSAGPKLFHGVRLPDDPVLDGLRAAGATVLRTDVHDGDCPLAERLGAERGPGGCDTYIITVDDRASGPLRNKQGLAR